MYFYVILAGCLMFLVAIRARCLNSSDVLILILLFSLDFPKNSFNRHWTFYLPQLLPTVTEALVV